MHVIGPPWRRCRTALSSPKIFLNCPFVVDPSHTFTPSNRWSVPLILHFPECHIIRIIQKCSLLSLASLTSRKASSMLLRKPVICSLLVCSELFPSMWRCLTLFIHSPVAGHLHWFQFLAFVYKFLHEQKFPVLLGKNLGVGLLNYMVGICLTLY